MNLKDTFNSAIHGMPALVTGGQPGYRAGDDKLVWHHPELSGRDVILMRSDEFDDGLPIHSRYSADEEAISPPLSWSGVPSGARSLVLIVQDPDAPTPEPFVHWLLYNIAPSVTSLPENIPRDPEPSQVPGAMQGKNSGLKIGWAGMAPPKGDTPHRYFFQLFALDALLPLHPKAGRGALIEAMIGHVIARGRMVGTYQRQ